MCVYVYVCVSVCTTLTVVRSSDYLDSANDVVMYDKVVYVCCCICNTAPHHGFDCSQKIVNVVYQTDCLFLWTQNSIWNLCLKFIAWYRVLRFKQTVSYCQSDDS
jgi:hypothetical protein